MFNHVLQPSALFPAAFWPKISSVTVSPASTTVETGKTRQFSAFLNSAADPVTTWSVAVGAGSIDSDGIYTAPATEGSATVRATLTGETLKWAQASVTLVLAGEVEVLPASVSIYADETQQFAATLNGGAGSFTWSMVSGTGSVSATGLYTAPAGATTAVVRATWVDNVAVYDDVTVTVSAVSGTVVAVTPTDATILVSQSQQFVATVDSVVSSAVHWSVRANGGSISRQGFYTAPEEATTATIRATLIADPDVYGEVDIDVEEVDDSVTVVSDGLIQITFRYSNGQLLSSDPEDAAVVDISAPGYVSAPREFVGGVLTVRPVGVGTATLEVSYVDPEDGPTTVTRTITVTAQ